jgi:hypothetical protein
MYANYKADGVSKYELYPLISRALANDANKPAYANTCAIRMSYALNKSGVLLGKAPSIGGTIVGDDKRNYWIRVKDLKSELQKRFRNGDFTYQLPDFPKNWNSDTQWHLMQDRVRKVKTEFLDKIENRNGIVVFEVEGWGDASGHFTLWDSRTKNLMYVGSSQIEKDSSSPRYYFWMVPYQGAAGMTKSITFWELK